MYKKKNLKHREQQRQSHVKRTERANQIGEGIQETQNKKCKQKPLQNWNHTFHVFVDRIDHSFLLRLYRLFVCVYSREKPYFV